MPILNSQTESLLRILKKSGPQEIPSVTLKSCAQTLINWQLATYNKRGLLELTNQEKA